MCYDMEDQLLEEISELREAMKAFSDAEEELGISLIVLLKALKQRSLFYRDAETGEIKRCEYCRIGFQDSPCAIFMYVGSGEEQRCCHVDFIDNYGKTYAMSKEELE